MTLLDILTRNILHDKNSKVFIVSAYSYIPTSDFGKSMLDSIYYLICSSLIPVAMGLLLPLFMYSAVLERETRIKGIMKSHGLTEIVYWLSITFTNFLFFLMIYTVFVLSGEYIFEIPFFINMGGSLMVGLPNEVADKRAVGLEPDRAGDRRSNLPDQLSCSQHPGLHGVDVAAVRVPGRERAAVPESRRGAEFFAHVAAHGLHAHLLPRLQAVHGGPLSPRGH